MSDPIERGEDGGQQEYESKQTNRRVAAAEYEQETRSSKRVGVEEQEWGRRRMRSVGIGNRE